MNSILKITCLQFNITWENPNANRLFIENQLQKISNTDLLVLPETFTSGFSMRTELAETMHGETVKWMQKMAAKSNIAILGSLFIRENNKTYNRMLLVEPNKTIQHYDKKHLFNYGDEGVFFDSGKLLNIFEYKNWRIKPCICYDLRFPVSLRNTQNYDLLVCIANWPKARVEAWNTLLKARAIENQAYVIGVNRTGIDANMLEYPGHTNCYDALGKQSIENTNKETLLNFKINKQNTAKIRKKLPFLKDQDSFIIEL